MTDYEAGYRAFSEDPNGEIQPLPDRIRAEADRAAGQWLTKENDMSGPSLVEIIEDAIKAVIRGRLAEIQEGEE